MQKEITQTQQMIRTKWSNKTPAGLAKRQFGKSRTVLVLTALTAALAAPVAAQELVLYGPQEVAAFATPPSDSGSRSLNLLSHDGGLVRVVRAWFPPNTDIPPHGGRAEGEAAFVTVLAGDMKLAMGDKYDESRLQTLPIGSTFVFTHENAIHFAKTGPAGAQLLLILAPEKDLNKRLLP